MSENQESDRSMRRMPCVEKKVSEMKSGDMRVSITGTVIDRQGKRIVLDDGTGKVNINFESDPEVEMNQFVRVLGMIVPAGKDVEIDGEIIQDMEKLDKDLYKKVLTNVR